MSIRTRVLALCVLASAGTGMSAAVHAQAVEGTDYRKIEPPQPTDSPGKIEVIEFFSYMCPHCKEFYPLVDRKSTRLNSSHSQISYAVFCLKKKIGSTAEAVVRHASC